MNAQQYIADKYRKHLEETVGQGYDAKNPVDFMSEFETMKLVDEYWFFKPIEQEFKGWEDIGGEVHDEIVDIIINNRAERALKKVDLGHLYDIASDYADERNGERR